MWPTIAPIKMPERIAEQDEAEDCADTLPMMLIGGSSVARLRRVPVGQRVDIAIRQRAGSRAHRRGLPLAIAILAQRCGKVIAILRGEMRNALDGRDAVFAVARRAKPQPRRLG